MKGSISATLLGLACVLSSRSATAGVRVVAPSGAAYTQISAAVNAAVDDDVILVKSGTYAGFTIANKSLAVVADTGASVNIQQQVRVQSLAATRSVVLAGLRVFPIANAMADALVVSGNAGSVRVERCDLRGPYMTTTSLPIPIFAHGAFVESSTDVAFVDCSLRGGTSTEYEGIHGLYSTTASIALHRTSLHGSLGGGADYYGYWGGDGAYLLGATLVVSSGCQFLGGPAATGSLVCWGGGDGIGAFETTQVFVQDSLLAPGRPAGCPSTVTTGLPYRLGPNATLTPVVGRARELHGPSLTREQHSLEMQFFGEPADRVELVLADGLRFQHRPDQHGVSLVRRRGASVVVSVGMIAGDGTLNWSLPIGELGPGVESSTIHAQAYFTDAAGSVFLSSPAELVLLDGAY